MKLLNNTKLYSIFSEYLSRLPYWGKLYKNTESIYQVNDTLKMHENVAQIATRSIKLNPSFFYGAMYVSYAVGVAIAVAAFHHRLPYFLG